MNTDIVPYKWRNLLLIKPITVKGINTFRVGETSEYDNEIYYTYKVLLNKGELDRIRIKYVENNV